MRIQDMTIGIVGNGTVGKALGRAYCEYVKQVKSYDIDPMKSDCPLYEALESDLIFLCLPTPLCTSGDYSYGVDIQVLAKFFYEHMDKYKESNFVLKSTVPLGFTELIVRQYGYTSLVHCPEFLTARTALYDANNPSRNVIGIPCGRTNKCAELLTEFLYQRHPNCPNLLTGSNESELIKLGVNGAYAHKIAYFNTLREIADNKELDWGVVRVGILLDGKIGDAHTLVPGPDGKYGFGGDCLPKDLRCLITSGEYAEVDMSISKAVLEVNKENRKRQ